MCVVTSTILTIVWMRNQSTQRPLILLYLRAVGLLMLINHKTFLCVCVYGLIRVNRNRYSAHRTRHEC